MKECFKCLRSLPLSEFYKHSKMADGTLNKCKECTKSDVRKRRRENPKVQEYDRVRGNRQPPEYQREYRERFPNKYRAHSFVNNAIRSGKMVRVQVCEDCGSDFRVEAHHDDYDFPEVVRWLCSLCHKRWHSENGEGKNPF